MFQKNLHIIQLWLTKQGYHIDPAQLETQFLSHPDIEGLTAITDTLNELKIHNIAAWLPPESRSEIEGSILAVLREEQREQLVLASVLTPGIIEIFSGGHNGLQITPDVIQRLSTGTAIFIDRNISPRKISWRSYKTESWLVIITLLFLSLILLQPQRHTVQFWAINWLLVL